jgi:ubiquinone/menaquinone biosynthesis C-methylase UbiE
MKTKNYLKIIKEKNIYKKKLIKCEICGSKDYEIVSSIGRIGVPGQYGEYNIVICKNCTLTFSNPRYVDEFYLSYYKKKYRKVAFGFVKPTKFYISNQIKRSLGILKYYKKKFKKKNNGVLLDHGCASGATMIPWIKDGWQAVGIDPHLPSVNYGVKSLNLDIKNCFGEELQIKSDTIDGCISLGSLEHSFNISSSMKELQRVIKEKGFLLIRWRSDHIIGSPFEYFNHNHYRFFTKTTWEILLNRYDFKVKKFINEKLEGYNSYNYIYAIKNSQKFKLKKKNLKSEYVNRKKYIEKKIINYNKMIQYVINNYTQEITFENIILIMKKYKMSLLNNYKLISLKRFKLEIKSYISFINEK